MSQAGCLIDVQLHEANSAYGTTSAITNSTLTTDANGQVTLPETVTFIEVSVAPDLSDLIGLLGEQDESLELDFAAVDADTPVVASIGSVKPVVENWISQTDPFIDSDWNPIIEELYYTSEFV